MFRPALLLLGLAGGALLGVAAASRGGGEGTATDAASNVAAIKAVPWYAQFWRPVPDPAAYARRRTSMPSRRRGTRSACVRRSNGRFGQWDDLVERSFAYHWGRAESDNAGGYGAFRPDGSAKPLLGALAAFLAGTPASRTLRTGSPLQGASCCLPGRPSREE